MQRRFKIKLSKLLVIVIGWQIIAVLISVYDYFLLTSEFARGYAPGFSFQLSLLFNTVAAFIGSVIGGSFLIFYVNEKYRERSYGFTILAVVVSFILIIGLITVLLGFSSAMITTGHSLTHPETIKLAKANIINPIHLKNIVAWGLVVAMTQLLLSVDLKFGHGVLWQFIKGKYRHPQNEKRIFMFLDLNSSTSIAEKLGNEKYHNLLKDFFSDITNPVLDNRGEIYQYVGDEAVVSWPYKYGIENSQCIQCYFDIKNSIEMNKEKYLSRYGLIPGFKAGIHYGNVIAGEIGVIKRDITFSGDVLNTTSRIQGMCKELKVDMLVSGELTHELPGSLRYIARSMGENKLRGREKNIELMTMELALA
jgi:adenylate cyclase